MGLVSHETYGTRGRLLLAFAALCLMLAFAAGPAANRALAACGNPVQCENTQPGDPQSDWFVDGSGDQTIQGFPTQMSVNVGQTINFKIKTPSTQLPHRHPPPRLLPGQRRAQDRLGHEAHRHAAANAARV